MNIAELVSEYAKARGDTCLLDSTQLENVCLEAVRFCAAYMDIQDISGNALPNAGEPAPETDPAIEPAYPVRDLDVLSASTNITVGEWGIIEPLFKLLAEREQAVMLEASRSAGVEGYGRSVSEIDQDIAMLKSPEGIPARAFSHEIIEV